jgi:hypothetical protein
MQDTRLDSGPTEEESAVGQTSRVSTGSREFKQNGTLSEILSIINISVHSLEKAGRNSQELLRTRATRKPNSPEMGS